MSQATVKRVLEFYREGKNKAPFVEWLESLDRKTRVRIRHRLSRVELGNLGDYSPIGEGLFELRFFFGPGYRVYFAEADETLIVIFLGGDKKSQTKDIQKAKEYWSQYQQLNEKAPHKI